MFLLKIGLRGVRHSAPLITTAWLLLLIKFFNILPLVNVHVSLQYIVYGLIKVKKNIKESEMLMVNFFFAAYWV